MTTTALSLDVDGHHHLSSSDDDDGMGQSPLTSPPAPQCAARQVTTYRADPITNTRPQHRQRS